MQIVLPASQVKLLGTLAEFRFELRRFLHFSECAALATGLQPQQHQLLLQVAGAPESTPVSIAYAAARLGLKHNSVVELAEGRQVLERLSGDHARELNEMAPRLIQTLEHVRLHADGTMAAEAE